MCIKYEWHNSTDYPEEDKYIIVKDKDGKEHNDHTWNGHCYYNWVIYEDGSGDGYRSRVDIVSWRYDN